MTPEVRPAGALMRMLMTLMGFVLLAGTADAACNTPTGAAGDMTYSTSANVMAYCDGTNWISMAGGVSLTVNTSGGVTPYGTTGDVQINGGGALSGDTGNLTYSASTLAAPIISASTGNITTLNSNLLNNTGLGTFGSILDNGGLTVLGAASMTTVSASAISGTIIQVGDGGGAACGATLMGALRYNSTSNTIQICSNSVWTSLASGTITGSGVSGGSATAIAFWNGPSSLTYESATTSGLYWDHTNARLGVGTNSPSTPLEVFNSNGSAYITATSYRENVLGGGLQFLHARGTLVSPSALQVGDVGGSIYFKGYDGGSFLNMAAIQSVMDSTPVLGTNLTGTLSFFTTPSSSLNAPLERMRISSAGNVGIGTQSPTSPLQVSGTATMDVANLVSQSVANVVGGLGNMISSGSAVVSTSSAGSVTFFTSGIQRMAINSSGRVGIGMDPTSTVNALLQVSSSIYSTGTVSGTWSGAVGIAQGSYINYMQVTPNGDTYFASNRSTNTQFGTGNVAVTGAAMDLNNGPPSPGVWLARNGVVHIGNTAGSSGWGFLNFYRSGAFIGNISQNGTTAVAYNTTSDRRVKEDIADTREGLQKLMLLPVRDFAFKADPSHTIVTGFIAQELEKVFPEAVTTNGDNGETKLISGRTPWSVDYGRVTPLIVKAVQELKADNDNLRAGLGAANDNIRRLEGEINALKRGR